MREELLRLIKLCEENSDLNLRITCIPVFGNKGEFITFKFFLDSYKECDQVGKDIWVVKSDFQQKDESIENIIKESCKCEPEDIFENNYDVNCKCNCDLYSKEEAEDIYYSRTLQEIKERLNFIKNKIDKDSKIDYLKEEIAKLEEEIAKLQEI